MQSVERKIDEAIAFAEELGVKFESENDRRIFRMQLQLISAQTFDFIRSKVQDCFFENTIKIGN